MKVRTRQRGHRRAGGREGAMSVYKVIELIGTSSQS
jgi:flavin-binding protein dodecin